VLDLVWAALCTSALAVLDTTALGTALVLAVVATCLGMGTATLALARRFR
jgi:L-serine deaminase